MAIESMPSGGFVVTGEATKQTTLGLADAVARAIPLEVERNA